MKKLVLPALIAALALTGCSAGGSAGAESSPSPTATPTPTVLTVSLATTCQFLYGSSLDGPVPTSTDIINRFVEHPDLSTVTRAEIEKTVSELATARKYAEPSIAPYIDAQAEPLRTLRGALTGAKNTSVNFDDYKAAGIELINRCRQYISASPARTTVPPAASSYTVSQQNAIDKAQSYLRVSGFSRDGLIEQLEYNQFSTDDATFAVDHIEVDWNAQAAAKAKSYMRVSSFSHGSLVDQLVYNGFTPEQAEFGATAAGL